jgi:hypothetical protein
VKPSQESDGQIAILANGQWERVRAWSTPSPHLWITECQFINEAAKWNGRGIMGITHRPSGMLVVSCIPDLSRAREIAKKLADWSLDWSLDYATIREVVTWRQKQVIHSMNGQYRRKLEEEYEALDLSSLQGADDVQDEAV